MIPEKKELLFATYQSFMDQVLGLCEPDTLKEIMLEDAMGFGTTTDEKIFGIEAFLNLIKIQNIQSEGLGFKWQIEPLSRYVSPAEDSAAFADDLYLNFEVNGDKIRMYLRISVILEYINDKWLVVHWHGSKPEDVKSEDDTFGIENWKQKVDTLEKLVAERTTELLEKNRELEIETALEKVRTVAMGMHEPKDMLEVCKTISQQLQSLGVKEIRNVQTAIFYESRGTYMNYEYYTKHHKTIMTETNYTNHNIQKDFAEKMLKGKGEFYITHIKEKEVKEWLTYQKTTNVFIDHFLEQANSLNYYWDSLGPIALGISTYVPLTTEEIDLFKRFRNVFELAYSRFLDIEKAIAQAREAQIEAALERVRSRSMGMQKSDELKEVIKIVYQQLTYLKIRLDHSGFVVDYTRRGDWHFWIADEQDIPSKITHPYFESVWATQFDEAKEKGSDFFATQLNFEEKNKFYNELLSYVPGLPQATKEFYLSCPGLAASTVLFNDVGLYIENFSGTPYSDEENNILMRFGKVFQQTYTRFNDLQIAEAQTREAKIEAALERVRARALAMQQPEELKEVAEVLRHEMGLLGVEELETCSIYINDENADKAECWYALKDVKENEKKLVSDHFTLNLNDTWVGREMLHFYNSQEKQTSIMMQGTNRKEWINYCEEKSVPLRGYYGEVIPDRTYHLYKFSHGAIGAATPGDISDESFGLLKRVASVFSLAYSRFRDLTQARIDLQQLKEEKKRAEDALTELKATQKQLIQSEKMASLGELTAGIAHEIQNPLNFVNNFSEVSKELLDEMKIELDNGNTEDAKEIADDVIQNLEKINHHGKRADAIVKGMLQHSRSSSGQKEPTDINALCDEYLRLSYHGLRAKDKSFNATMKTDYDNSIGSINIIPQDIGRVVLNLLTNAFYAVDERRRDALHASPLLNASPLHAPHYEPTVSISTKKIGDKVKIKVTDNGNGIPQSAIDKIFQPFFTTKPTGKGTGLGLSMSYEIITKGHNGELKVTTKEGEGTTFTITI